MASSVSPVWRSLMVTWLMQCTVPLMAEVTKLIRLRWWGVSREGHFSVAAYRSRRAATSAGCSEPAMVISVGSPSARAWRS